MLTKYFKNQPINSISWLFASRGKVQVFKDHVVIGGQKICPIHMLAYEKTSWLTKNYYVVSMYTEQDEYVVSLNAKAYKRLCLLNEVNLVSTSPNISRNVTFMMVIVANIYFITKLISRMS